MQHMRPMNRIDGYWRQQSTQSEYLPYWFSRLARGAVDEPKRPSAVNAWVTFVPLIDLSVWHKNGRHGQHHPGAHHDDHLLLQRGRQVHGAALQGSPACCEGEPCPSDVVTEVQGLAKCAQPGARLGGVALAHGCARTCLIAGDVSHACVPRCLPQWWAAAACSTWSMLCPRKNWPNRCCTPTRHRCRCSSRPGKHARTFLQGCSASLLVDDHAGYKRRLGGAIKEGSCWAHAGRKFFELHVANKYGQHKSDRRAGPAAVSIRKSLAHKGLAKVSVALRSEPSCSITRAK